MSMVELWERTITLGFFHWWVMLDAHTLWSHWYSAWWMESFAGLPVDVTGCVQTNLPFGLDADRGSKLEKPCSRKLLWTYVKYWSNPGFKIWICHKQITTLTQWSAQLSQFVLRRTWTSEQNFIAIHQTVIEIFQAGKLVSDAIPVLSVTAVKFCHAMDFTVLSLLWQMFYYI